MLKKSPSGALSPYYYKGGYFHGIHYGSYFDNMDALLNMMRQEEAFILNKTEHLLTCLVEECAEIQKDDPAAAIVGLVSEYTGRSVAVV